MNTLLLLPAVFASHGGIERMLRLYVRAFGELSPKGNQLNVVVLNDATVDPTQWAPYATAALAPTVACGRRKVRCVWHTLRRARQASRIVVGHVHLLPLARLVRRLGPAKQIWLIAHGIEVWRDFSPDEQAALRGTDRILCVSDYTRQQLLSRCPGLRPERLHVQPNALDPQFDPSAALACAAQPGLILSVARLCRTEAYKGIDRLIAALPLVRSHVPAARLRVVGDGDERPRLEELAREHGVAESVEFTGRVSDSALRGHFAACQLFALPSRGEGFGLVYVEALAHGKPCLAANAGGTPEVVDNDHGVLVDDLSPEPLASACVAALTRPWDAERLRARARAFSYETFRQRLAPLVAS